MTNRVLLKRFTSLYYLELLAVHEHTTIKNTLERIASLGPSEKFCLTLAAI
jgi:hypothetical protein